MCSLLRIAIVDGPSFRLGLHRCFQASVGVAVVGEGLSNTIATLVARMTLTTKKRM